MTPLRREKNKLLRNYTPDQTLYREFRQPRMAQRRSQTSLFRLADLLWAPLMRLEGCDWRCHRLLLAKRCEYDRSETISQAPRPSPRHRRTEDRRRALNKASRQGRRWTLNDDAATDSVTTNASQRQTSSVWRTQG